VPKDLELISHKSVIFVLWEWKRNTEKERGGPDEETGRPKKCSSGIRHSFKKGH